MPDLDVPVRRVIGIVLGVGVVLIVAGVSVSWLLTRWHLPPGGETGSAALIAPIPAPQLQTAPQAGRASQRASEPSRIGSASTDDAAAASLAFEQRLGTLVPPHLRLTDADGGPADWTGVQDPRPIVLVPAYFRCDTLCGTVAHGVIEALADTGLPTAAWRLWVVSFDPGDSPSDALALQRVYARYAGFARPAVYANHEADLRLLVGDAASTHALAKAIGFGGLVDEGLVNQDLVNDNGRPDFAHATGLVVLTPQGVVSRYLFGVRFDPRALRLALVDASDERIGSFTDRLVLACAHLDPTLGRHDAAVIWLTRAVGVSVLIALAAFAWRHREDKAGAT